MGVIAALACAPLACAATGAAQEALRAVLATGWRAIDMQAGGWITGFAASADGAIVFARTDVGGLYASLDGGANWRARSLGMRTPAGLLVQGVAAHPKESPSVLVAVGASYLPADPARGIWRSRDTGKTWRHVLAGVGYSGNDPARWGGECIVHDAKRPDTVYAGSRDSGLHRSRDGGDTWATVAPFTTLGGSIDALAVHKDRENEIWAAGSAGIWVSRDGGDTWTLRHRDAKHPQVYRLLVRRDGVVFAATGNALLRLDPAPQGILDLTPQFDAGQPAQGELTALMFVDGDETRLLASRIGAPTRVSTDGGLQWSPPLGLRVTGGFPLHAFRHSSIVWGRNHFFQRPTAMHEWLATGGYGAFRSADGGQTFEHVVSGMSLTVAYRPTFHPTDERIVYLPISDWVMARLVDGTVADYARVKMAAGGPHHDLALSNATHVLVSAAAPNRAYLVGGSIYDSPQGKEHGAIFATDDSGATYRRVAGVGLPVGARTSIVDGVVSSRDAKHLALLVQGDAAERGVFLSEDGGETFARATGLRGTAPALFTVKPALIEDALDVNRRLLWLAGGGLFVSGDQGRSWAALSQALPDSTRELAGALVADTVKRGRMYLALSDGANRGGLWRSRDGGLHWTQLRGWRGVSAVDARDGVVVAIGVRRGRGHGVWRSRDGGQRWNALTSRRLRLPNATAIRIDPRNTNRVLVATNGLGVYVRVSAPPPPILPAPSASPEPGGPTPSTSSTPNVSPSAPSMGAPQEQLCDAEALEAAVLEAAGTTVPGAERSDHIEDAAHVARLGESDVGRRLEALRALSMSGGPRAVEGLIVALRDAETLLRLEAVDALGRVGSPRAIEGIIVALRDVATSVRGAALRALAAWPGPRATEGLVVALLDQTEALRLGAVKGLASRPGARAVEGLVGALADAAVEVRLATVEGLATRTEPRAVDGLAMATRDAASAPRLAAVRALGSRAGRRACLALVAASRSGDDETRTLAAATFWQRVRR